MRNLKRLTSMMLAVVMMMSLFVLPTSAANTPAYGGDKKGNVTVTVKTPSGGRVSGAQVQLEDLTAGRYQTFDSKTTNASGQCTWTGLSSGQYRATITSVPANYKLNSNAYTLWLDTAMDASADAPITVLEKMKQNGVYDENTPYDYIRQLMMTTPSAANVEEYIGIVRDKALLRQVAETAGAITSIVQEGTATAQEALEAAEQRIFAIRRGRASQGLEHISSVIYSLYDRLSELAASDSAVPGLSTGFPDVDSAIAGLNKSDLILLAARPGMGKTSMALNMLLHAGKFSGKAVVYFSLEMSREQLAMRLISNESFVDLKKLITGRLGEDDWDKIAAASAALNQTNILIDDNPMLSVTDMNAKCRRVDNLGLVVIDYLQLMTSAGGPGRYGDNRQQIVSDISRALKIMAKELNVPVLCLS